MRPFCAPCLDLFFGRAVVPWSAAVLSVHGPMTKTSVISISLLALLNIIVSAFKRRKRHLSNNDLAPNFMVDQ